MKKEIFFYITIIFYLFKYTISLNSFGKGVSPVSILSSFTYPEDVNGLISNDLTHETFSKTTSYSNPYESSIFFIIGNQKIQSLYFTLSSIYQKDVEELSSTSATLNDLYSISSSYLFLPKDILYDTNTIEAKRKSALFGLCTNGNYISSYIFEYNTDINNLLIDQKLINNNMISYDDVKITTTENKCSGSSFIGKSNFGDRVYISNAYSKYSNDNEVMNLHYEIKIFEYITKTYELKYYVGKSLKIEIINYSTSPPSNFNDNVKNYLQILLNKQRISLIK